MADAGADVVGVDWRTPLDRPAASSARASAVQGNLDPTMLPRAVVRRRRTCPRRAAARRWRPATCSTSATVCFRRRLPTRSLASSSSCTTRPSTARQAGLTRGSGPTDGVRDAIGAGGGRGLLHAHPARAAAGPEQLDDLLPAMTPSVARRHCFDHRGAGARRRRRARRDVAVALGMKHAAPFIEDAMTHAGGPDDPSLPSCSRRTTPRVSVGEYFAPRGGSGRAGPDGHRRARHGISNPPCSTRWPHGSGTACARLPAAPRLFSPPTRCPSGSSQPAIRTRRRCERPQRRSRQRAGVQRWSTSWQSAGRTERAVARPRHRRGTSAQSHRQARRACSCARLGSSPTASRSCTTSTSSPHSVARRDRHRLRPHAITQRRSRSLRDRRIRRPPECSDDGGRWWRSSVAGSPG